MQKLIVLVCLGYALIVLGVFIFQRNLMYFPNREPVGNPRSYGLAMQRVTVRTADGLELAGWFAPPQLPDIPVIVLFHGNAGNISHRDDKAQYFLKKGYGFLLAEYRGYGGNPGKLTEEGLYADGRAWLNSIKDFPVVLWGESLGTGVAVQMATEYKPVAVVLEAPFTAAADVGRRAYPYLPVNFLIRDRFDNLKKISNIGAPLLIVHGDRDGTVLYELGQKLFDAAPQPKEFATLKGAGHNGLMDFGLGDSIEAFLRPMSQTTTGQSQAQ